jgi:proline iminopeptidase
MSTSSNWLFALVLLSGCAGVRHAPSAPVEEGYVRRPGDIRLFYRIAGQGSDTIVVLHDGPALHMQAIAPDLEPLTRSHVLLYYDQRGGGRSDSLPNLQRVAILDDVADLEALRKHFQMEQLTILGHGWGAGLASLYADKWPERIHRLLLVAPISPAAEPFVAQAEARRRTRLGSSGVARLDVLEHAWESTRNDSATTFV